MESGGAVAELHCIEMAGDDARRFAQSQFAGDVDALASGRWQWNAWLDAGGRVAALMHLVDPGDGSLLAILRGGDAAGVRAALARYLLRSRTALALRAFTGYADAAMDIGVCGRAGEDLVIGCGTRSLRLVPVAVDIDARASKAWRMEDIRAGWPVLPAAAPGFLPPALGLERLGAISFDKGCFPGQEIAARLHFRGGHKLRLQHVRGTAPLSIGRLRGPGEAASGYVLDSIDADGTTEALVVAPKPGGSKINLMNDTYDVVSMFEP